MKKGFTLIELLVVVLIIGILAAIAVPQYQKAVIKSRFANLKLMVSSVVKAQEEYYLATGDYTNEMKYLSIDLPLENEKYTCAFNGKIAFGCNNGLMYYQSFYKNASNYPGKIECGVLDNTNTNLVEICKTETGKTEPDWTRGIYSSYNY